MKTTLFAPSRPLSAPALSPEAPPYALYPACPLPIQPLATAPGEAVKHILIGSPGAVRQTIHLLHALHYCETVLWSRVLRIEAPVVITPEQGDAMSLLRKMV